MSLSLLGFAAIITILAPLNLSAQSENKFQFEMMFSPMMTWLKSENSEISGGVKGAFSYGLLFSFNFADNYAFQTGILSSNNRGKFSGRLIDTMSAYSSVESFRLNYLDIPLTLKLKSNEVGYVTYWGRFGIIPGMRVKARDTFDEPYMGADIDNENIIKDGNEAMIKSRFFNISLTMAAGIDYAISGETKVFGAITFNNGFANVLDDGDDEKTVLRSLGLQAGIIF